MDVGGFFLDFEAVRTDSTEMLRAGPRRPQAAGQLESPQEEEDGRRPGGGARVEFEVRPDEGCRLI